MRALVLTTRFREGQFEAEARLLVYDEFTLDGATVGDDVRDMLDQHPNTPRIYVLAPFLPFETVKESVRAGTAPHRASSSSSGVAGQLSVIGIHASGVGSIGVVSCAMIVENGAVRELPERPLPNDLSQGWLFDLFDRAKARVDAPPGVHFGKMSGKHSDKFLRTSAALLSTRACAAVAFFALQEVRVAQPRRIFVDTAPLLSVALAMGRTAKEQGLWDFIPPAQSFSSYGGLDSTDMPAFGRGDLVLISASTTGGLAKRLVTLYGVDAEAIITLFQLSSEDGAADVGRIACDLTYRPKKTFGYAKVKNYSIPGCALCDKGYVLASLEGDQFLLEKLGVKRVRVTGKSQPQDAQVIVDRLTKTGVFGVRLFRSSRTARTDVTVDVESLLSLPGARSEYVRLLTRFTPTPVAYVILEGISRPTFDSLAAEAGLSKVLEGATYVLSKDLAQQDTISGGNALVAVGCLDDHAALRTINAQLRLKVPQGCVSYLAAMAIAESPKSLSSLRTFLSWGEYGPDTFIYRGALEFMLPRPSDPPSPWDRELELLQSLIGSGGLPCPEHQARIDDLQQSSIGRNSIFLRGQQQPLALANDFVYLDTKVDHSLITQADVYATVSNLWACAKCDNSSLRSDLRDPTAIEWLQSTYGQVLLCPSNFTNYNDAVLRAAFLRTCRPEELCYAVDERCSSEVLDVCLAELANWPLGKGDALPEFLLAMATRRLTLSIDHVRQFKAAASELGLPRYLAQLVEVIPDS